MGKLYSALIFEGHDLGDVTDVTLDPGYLWIVRNVDVFFPGPNAFAQFSLVAVSNECTFIAFDDTEIAGNGVSHHWEGRQVFAPISGLPTLQVKTSTSLGGADVRISGYQLTLP